MISSPRGFFWPMGLPARAVCVSKTVSISSVSEKRKEANTVKRNDAQKRRTPFGREPSAAAFSTSKIKPIGAAGACFLPVEVVPF